MLASFDYSRAAEIEEFSAEDWNTCIQILNEKESTVSPSHILRNEVYSMALAKYNESSGNELATYIDWKTTKVIGWPDELALLPISKLTIDQLSLLKDRIDDIKFEKRSLDELAKLRDEVSASLLAKYRAALGLATCAVTKIATKLVNISGWPSRIKSYDVASMDRQTLEKLKEQMDQIIMTRAEKLPPSAQNISVFTQLKDALFSLDICFDRDLGRIEFACLMQAVPGLKLSTTRYTQWTSEDRGMIRGLVFNDFVAKTASKKRRIN